jgi:hypothetical protein
LLDTLTCRRPTRQRARPPPESGPPTTGYQSCAALAHLRMALLYRALDSEGTWDHEDTCPASRPSRRRRGLRPRAADAPANPRTADAPADPRAADAPANPTTADAPANPTAADAPANPRTADAPANPRAPARPSAHRKDEVPGRDRCGHPRGEADPLQAIGPTACLSGGGASASPYDTRARRPRPGGRRDFPLRGAITSSPWAATNPTAPVVQLEARRCPPWTCQGGDQAASAISTATAQQVMVAVTSVPWPARRVTAAPHNGGALLPLTRSPQRHAAGQRRTRPPTQLEQHAARRCAWLAAPRPRRFRFPCDTTLGRACRTVAPALLLSPGRGRADRGGQHARNGGGSIVWAGPFKRSLRRSGVAGAPPRSRPCISRRPSMAAAELRSAPRVEIASSSAPWM